MGSDEIVNNCCVAAKLPCIFQNPFITFLSDMLLTVNNCYLYCCRATLQISKSAHNFLSDVANQPTERQANAGKRG